MLIVHHELSTRSQHLSEIIPTTVIIPVIPPGAIGIKRNDTGAGSIGAGKIQRTVPHFDSAGKVIGGVENQDSITRFRDTGAGQITIFIHKIGDTGIR